MKKVIYTSVFSILALGFMACSEVEEDVVNSENEVEVTEDELTTEKIDELNKTIELQEDAEKLDAELSEFIESL